MRYIPDPLQIVCLLTMSGSTQVSLAGYMCMCTCVRGSIPELLQIVFLLTGLGLVR